MMNEQTDSTAAAQFSTRSARRPLGLIVSVAFGVGLLTLLFWQFIGVASDGKQFQVLNPDLHLIWKVFIIGSVGISTACPLIAWVRRGWKISLAIVNTVANGVGAAVTIALTVLGKLFISTLPIQIGARGEATTDLDDLTELFLLLVVASAIWNSVKGILRARRSRTAPRAT